MAALLLRPELSPFVISAGLVFGLLLFEIMLMMTGLSSHGDSGAIDLGHDADLGSDIGDLSAPELAAELEVSPEIAAQIEMEIAAHLDVAEGLPSDISDVSEVPVSAVSGGGPLDFLGIRKLPLTLWLALFLAGFAGAGFALQMGMNAALGWMLPRLVASVIALVPAVALTRELAGTIARLIPRDETAAISERSLGRRRGVVTVGTARRGSPAQVRITDQYGNVHYTMVEPLADADEIPQGAEVLVLRLRRGLLRLVQIG